MVVNFSQYPATQITDESPASAVETCVAYLGKLDATTYTVLPPAKPDSPPAGVVLTYGSGQDGKSTQITFVCDPSQTSITIPQFQGVTGTVYKFTWVSAAACPKAV
jgi:hypothetical protein